MTKEEFEALSEGLKMDVCREIAYDYAVFVPKEEEKAISKFKSLVKFSDKKYLDKNVLDAAGGKPIFPYHMMMGKVDDIVERYYRNFSLGENPREILAQYGSRGEELHTYYENCLKAS